METMFSPCLWNLATLPGSDLTLKALNTTTQPLSWSRTSKTKSVITRISVADPRGAFVMYTEANETGHYLSVPHPDERLPHVDELETKGRGYYRMHLPPLNRKEEEE